MSLGTPLPMASKGSANAFYKSIKTHGRKANFAVMCLVLKKQMLL